MSPWSRRAIRRLADCGQEGLESGLPRRARVRADPGHDACVCAGSWTPLRGEFDSDCGIGPDGPGLDVIGIRPHEVAEAAFVRNLLPPINQPHLVDRAELWRESTVHTQDAAVHDGGEGAPARRRRRGGGVLTARIRAGSRWARQGTNQIVPCSTSTGSRSRTCAGIRRKTRRPV